MSTHIGLFSSLLSGRPYRLVTEPLVQRAACFVVVLFVRGIPIWELPAVPCFYPRHTGRWATVPVLRGVWPRARPTFTATSVWEPSPADVAAFRPGNAPEVVCERLDGHVADRCTGNGVFLHAWTSLAVECLGSVHRGQYLGKPKPGQALPDHQKYRKLYPKIIKDIEVRALVQKPLGLIADRMVKMTHCDCEPWRCSAFIMCY